MNPEDFKNFATKHRGISSITLDNYTSVYGNYISPTIIEERQMNIATMDVFSRLMMDRIIFLGVASAFTIPCSILLLTWLLSAQAWQPQWAPCCYALEQKVKGRP